jgi:hypothetical protein
MNKYLASELFCIEEKSSLFPLNLKFALNSKIPKSEFEGAFVYSISFDNTKIYIGYCFNDKQNDIRKSRWSKQLESILFRGYRVGLNSKSLIELEKVLKHKLSPRNLANIKVKKTDVMTSVNRLLFANTYWDEIKFLDSKNQLFLKRISFQIEDSCDLSSRKDFKHKTKELIKQMKPRCNG